MPETETNSIPQKLFFLHYPDPDSLAASYMPFIRNGGLFIPTTNKYTLGDQLFLLIRFVTEPGQHASLGTVVWISPDQWQQGKKPGIGVRLDDRESRIRGRLENYLPDRKSSMDSCTM